MCKLPGLSGVGGTAWSLGSFGFVYAYGVAIFSGGQPFGNPTGDGVWH